MNPKEAKATVAQLLNELAVSYYKLSARTLSFQDLARDSAVIVTIHGPNWTTTDYRYLKQQLKNTKILVEVDNALRRDTPTTAGSGQ